ncbi:MAG: 3',5'-cyclic-nucleotide phosphodiesterase [Burkholderiaceae bacterium]|nr:3',5'-cyclic-nucleotide phosphodiesterase [Burkholderiaceae bacterium]
MTPDSHAPAPTAPPPLSIRVLGCSGAIAAGSRTTAFLIGDDVLIDAGTGVGDLTLAELARIDHILLSHSHLDHVLAIALLADSVLAQRQAAGRPPIQVHALAPTLAALRDHIFNGVIWPDFTRLPSAEHPALEFVPFEHGDRLVLGGKTIEVLCALHTVPAAGFAVQGGAGGDDAGGWWVFTGDTGPNPLLWQRLQSLRVEQLVIEAAFGNAERALAGISRHLCPATLGAELAALGAPLNACVDVYITHVKPGELDAVMGEIARIETPHRIRPLAAGQVMRLG